MIVRTSFLLEVSSHSCFEPYFYQNSSVIYCSFFPEINVVIFLCYSPSGMISDPFAFLSRLNLIVELT